MTFSKTNIFSSVLLILGLFALTVSCQRPRNATTTTTTTTTATTTATTTTTELPEETVVSDVELIVDEGSTKPPLTGIPQIDYIWDPNLPRELNGYNMSNYPFLRSIPAPETIAFKCDGLHDGFYASVALKCQVYHQCLFGLRYDFLCANFTAFDQKNFICHFANEVDCDNSHLFFDKNEALYKTTSTTPLPTAPPIIIRGRFADGRRRRPGSGGRRRRPQRPVFYDDDYYDYEDEEYDDVPGNEDQDEETKPKKVAKTESDKVAEPENPVEENGDKEERRQQRPASGKGALFNNNRPPPRIRPPVPTNVADDFALPTAAPKKKTKTTPSPLEEEEEEDQEQVEVTTSPSKRAKAMGAGGGRRKNNNRSKKTTTTTPEPHEDYEDYEDDEVSTTTTLRPRKAKMSSAKTTTTTTTTVPVEEDSEIELNPKQNALQNRKGPAAALIRRRIASNPKTTSPPSPVEHDEDLIEEDQVEEDNPTPISTTSTSTTTATSRRTTKARPPRPGTSRTRVPETSGTTTTTEEVEEDEQIISPTTFRSNKPQAETVKDVPAAVSRTPSRVPAPLTGRNRAQNPSKRDDVAAIAGSETLDVDNKEPGESRKGRNLEPESLKTILDDVQQEDKQDKEFGESQQWSIISLFSRVLPQRA